MEDKKQMRKQTIFAICMLAIGIMASVVIAVNDSDVDFTTIEDGGYLEISSNWTMPDYSEEGYIKINPGNTTRLIYLECINSTLMIANNKIYCEAD